MNIVKDEEHVVNLKIRFTSAEAELFRRFLIFGCDALKLAPMPSDADGERSVQIEMANRIADIIGTPQY